MAQLKFRTLTSRGLRGDNPPFRATMLFNIPFASLRGVTPLNRLRVISPFATKGVIITPLNPRRLFLVIFILLLSTSHVSYGFLEYFKVGKEVLGQGKEAHVWVKQYQELNEIKELSKKSDSELKALNQVQTTNSAHNKNILDILEDYIEKSEDLYELATDKNKQHRLLYDKADIFFGEGSTRLTRKIINTYTYQRKINIKDLRSLYNIVSLNEEEQLIIKLKNKGLTDAQVASLVNKDEIPQMEQDLLAVQKDIFDQELLVQSLSTELEDLTTQLGDESSNKKRSELFERIHIVSQHKLTARRHLRELKKEGVLLAEGLQRIEIQAMLSLLNAQDEIKKIEDDKKRSDRIADYQKNRKDNLAMYVSHFQNFLRAWF